MFYQLSLATRPPTSLLFLSPLRTKAAHQGKKQAKPQTPNKRSVALLSSILTHTKKTGDDPPRDRTSELRKKGFQGRRLGPVQMTTDTAVRVTRMVVQDGYELTKIPYVDHPEIRVDEHESTQMPFRYVVGEKGQPVFPEVSFDSPRLLEDSCLGGGVLFC